MLVPGAGLGRLAFEIARCGYSCQGNEFSLFMLFASNFVLNRFVCIHCVIGSRKQLCVLQTYIIRIQLPVQYGLARIFC